jgi:hypothetical protein
LLCASLMEHGIWVKMSHENVKYLTKRDFGTRQLLNHQHRAWEKAKKQHKTGLFGFL